MNLGLSQKIVPRRSRRSDATLCEFSTTIPWPNVSIYTIGPIHVRWEVPWGIKRKFTVFFSPLLEHFPGLVLRKLKGISKNGNAFRSRWEVFVPLPSKEASRADEEEAQENSESQRFGWWLLEVEHYEGGGGSRGMEAHRHSNRTSQLLARSERRFWTGDLSPP